MSRDDRYRVGIYADWHNPESIPNYKAKIVTGTTFIMLPQYPSPNHRFIIKDFIQVENREDIVNENEGKIFLSKTKSKEDAGSSNKIKRGF